MDVQERNRRGRARCRGVVRNVLLAAPLLVAACAQSPNTTAQRVDLDANTPTLLTPGDMQMSTLRPRPVRGADAAQTPKVLCTQPSPDWATALATALQLTASGSAPGGPSASASGAYNATETIAQMAGRSSGVVALRDGLYAACQAYANGILGQDAYALILSQYGNLLIKLVSATGSGSSNGKGGNNGSGGASASNGAPSGALVNVLAAGAPAAAPAPAKAPATTPDTKPAAPSDPMAEARADAVGAMLVACITEDDPTRLIAGRNPLLLKECPTLLHGIATAAPSLLAPPDGAGIRQTPPPKAAPDAQVQAYQRNLQKLGLYHGAIDGIAGSQTKAAVKAFQTAHGLSATGDADPATIAAMHAAASS